MNIDEILKLELNLCYKYFHENTNLDESSICYGLVKDKYPKSSDVASISATGYGLISIVIGIENNLLSYNDGYNQALKSLNTLINLENKNGFYYHYLDFNTGKRVLNSEISIIDTTILMCGILLLGEYFQGEIKLKSKILYNRVKWTWFVDKKNHMLRLGYKNRFYGYWDNYAEQLIIYILGAGSNTYPLSIDTYNSFNRNIGEYNNHKDIIYSWFGSLFTYHYSHGFIDFRNLCDNDNINWFNNSKKATLANIEYCLENKQGTFKEGFWGLSSTITKRGYIGRIGAKPFNYSVKTDGTVSISSILSSIVFCDQEVKDTILKLYNKYPNIFGEYGFKTSINIGKRKTWISEEYLSIDKGSTMVMLSNYYDEIVWKYLMNTDEIQNGLSKLNINKRT